MKLPNPPDHDWQLSRLAAFVLANAPFNTPVRTAFETYDAQRNREGGPTWGAQQAAWNAWRSITREERSKILNGWNAEISRPSISEIIAAGNEVTLALCVECAEGGRLLIGPEFDISDGRTAPVRVLIAQGTDRPTALVALRAITAALEKHFAQAIQLHSPELIEAQASDFRPTVESVESAIAAVESAAAKVVDDLKALAWPVAGEKSAAPVERLQREQASLRLAGVAESGAIARLANTLAALPSGEILAGEFEHLIFEDQRLALQLVPQALDRSKVPATAARGPVPLDVAKFHRLAVEVDEMVKSAMFDIGEKCLLKVDFQDSGRDFNDRRGLFEGLSTLLVEAEELLCGRATALTRASLAPNVPTRAIQTIKKPQSVSTHTRKLGGKGRGKKAEAA